MGPNSKATRLTGTAGHEKCAFNSTPRTGTRRTHAPYSTVRVFVLNVQKEGFNHVRFRATEMLTAAALLELEQVTDFRFRNIHNLDNYQNTIFGGQPLGQALAAAQRTIPGWLPHTCTGYFLRAGSVAEPIDYEVEPVRDGRRYAARRVLASQAGKPIFDLLCSFHDEEAGFAHQRADEVPVPSPESLPTVLEFVRAHADRLPKHVVERHEAAFPIEMRLVDPELVFFGNTEGSRRTYWCRMPSAATVAGPHAHRCLLAFMSDYWLASPACAPHRSPGAVGAFFLATLNHSLWFHGPVRADEWLLFRTESPWAGEGRGLARGHIYDRRGRLVASAVQEVSMRSG
jgi:acyl-CoA thioesterase II